MVFGLMASATSVGGFIGPLAGAGLAAGIGFRATFVVCGMMMLSTVVVLLWTERKGRTPGEQPETVATA